MIDIYTCPNTETPSIDYMLAVMSAAKHGATVERSGDGVNWGLVDNPKWNWGSGFYRIKRPVAPALKPGDWIWTPAISGRNLNVKSNLVQIEQVDAWANGCVHAEGETWIAAHCRAATKAEIDLHMAYLAARSAPEFKVGDYVVSTDPFSTRRAVPITGIDGNYLLFAPDCCARAYASDYRKATDAEIAAYNASQLAPGHNVAKLTAAQVQTQDGYRLLDRDELKVRNSTPQIHRWLDDGWYDTISWAGSEAECTYRTRLSRAELAALDAPAPVKRMPLTPVDLPPVCWMRRIAHPQCSLLITFIGITHVTLGATSDLISFAALLEQGWEYSSDRKAWTPCYKLV